MYGMINKAIEDMVRMRHGESTWARIKAAAGVDDLMFFSHEAYPDELTYRLVAAAGKELGSATDAILAAFGEHWITYTAREGYGNLMRAAGDSLPVFLANLPNFHGRVTMIFPALQPPRFTCTEVTQNSLLLHYYTRRGGLAPFVKGLLQGLGKHFDTPVQVEQIDSREDGMDHDVFKVSWSAPTREAAAT